jgi:twitching motility protein PilT
LGLKEQFRQVALSQGLLDGEQVELTWDFYMFEGRRRHPAEVAVSLGYLAADRVGPLMELVAQSQSEVRARRRAEAASSPPESRSASPPRPEAPSSKPGKALARAAQARAVTPLQLLVRQAIEAGASDLYLHSGEVPFVRVAGELRGLESSPVEHQSLAEELQEMLSGGQWEVLSRDGEVNLSLTFEGGYRLRVNVFRGSKGVCASMRLVAPAARGLRELNLPLSASSLMEFHQGLVVLAGPASSGKSATLVALINQVAQSRRVHVVTIEDPIEYVFEPQRATVTQRNVGLHTQSYHSALRAALREDPDVLVIGELVDVETIRIALEAAETGHLVLGTMHAWNIEGAIGRLMDAFGEEEAQMRGLIGDALRGVMVQQLVRSTAGALVPVVELMLNNAAIAHCIRQRKLHQIQSMMHAGKGQKMLTVEDSLRELRQRRMLSAQDEARVLAELKRLSE